MYRPHLLISHTEDAADKVVSLDEIFHPKEALLAAGQAGNFAEQQVRSSF
jgi:hypothetical protein